MVAKSNETVLQFKVSLLGIEPEIWRRIVVPVHYSFWDLHVAIQDAMGWTDSHLHLFRVLHPKTATEEQIGIPDPTGEEEEDRLRAGWDIPIAPYFPEPGKKAAYEYDFGDGWEHEVVLEQILDPVPRRKYPQCLDGARACPPEDCGGVAGFANLLAVMNDPNHKGYEDMIDWLGYRFDPVKFSPKKVRFDDPQARRRAAFGV